MLCCCVPRRRGITHAKSIRQRSKNQLKHASVNLNVASRMRTAERDDRCRRLTIMSSPLRYACVTPFFFLRLYFGAPRSVLGGFRAQGRTADKAKQVVEDALAVQEAGAFAVVVECVPSPVARAVTEALEIPTIGIGAGPSTSGQVSTMKNCPFCIRSKQLPVDSTSPKDGFCTTTWHISLFFAPSRRRVGDKKGFVAPTRGSVQCAMPVGCEETAVP